jgi:arylsulfatase A-like enzyme
MMREEHTPPEYPKVQRGTPSLLGAAQHLRQILALAALLGLLFGLGEGAVDLTVLHFHAPEILYITVLGNLLLFLILGLFFGTLGIGLERGTSYALVFFIFLWIATHGLGQELALDASRREIWLLSLIVTGMIVWALSFYVGKYNLNPRRVVARTLPLLAGMVLACLAGISGYQWWVEQRAAARLPWISPDAPNVVLVIVDTLRADHLSSYGYHHLTSPHLDQLASEGVLFENAIATSSWTLPSHASMLTGLYSSEHGGLRLQDQLPANIPTLAEALSKAGYRTAGFSGSPFFTRQQGLGRGFGDFQDRFLTLMGAFSQVHYLTSIFASMAQHGWTRGDLGRETAADANRAALRWIDRFHGPFFLALNYYDVHTPQFAPVPREPQGRSDIYDGGIAYDDTQLQWLMDELGRRRLLDNTLVIVTADHGEGLGEHGLWGHGTALYFPLIHVPLVFFWPNRIPAGLRLDRPVSTKDIPATVLALTGVTKDLLPGDSLVGLWTGRTDPNKWPPPISELAESIKSVRGPRGQDALIESIVSSNLQLILEPHNGPSLFDLKTDPLETKNLFLDPHYQAAGVRLAAELHEGRISVPGTSPGSKRPAEFAFVK